MLGLRIFDLRDSTLLEDIRETAQVGKYERMEALAALLSELHRGDSLSLLVPWYLAYGATGNEHVAPYSNIRIEIIVEK
jgi:FKBP-type peptidyl-prolyl cis-trans isomerase